MTSVLPSRTDAGTPAAFTDRHIGIGAEAQAHMLEVVGCDTVEALVIAARAGMKVGQVGVTMRPRAGGRPSHSPVKAAVFLVRAMLALSIALTRPGVPKEERV